MLPELPRRRRPRPEAGGRQDQPPVPRVPEHHPAEEGVMGKKNKKKTKVAKRRPLVVVFSGTRSIQTAQFPYVDAAIDALKAKAFVSGGAYGIDSYCATEAIRRFPKAQPDIIISTLSIHDALPA